MLANRKDFRKASIPAEKRTHIEIKELPGLFPQATPYIYNR